MALKYKRVYKHVKRLIAAFNAVRAAFFACDLIPALIEPASKSLSKILVLITRTIDEIIDFF